MVPAEVLRKFEIRECVSNDSSSSKYMHLEFSTSLLELLLANFIVVNEINIFQGSRKILDW